MPWMAAILGWLRLARICASRREPGEAVRIVGEGVGEDLQGDLAVELRVCGLPDLAHAPLAEQGGDVVMAETGARAESHELGGAGDRSIVRASGHGLHPTCTELPAERARSRSQAGLSNRGSEG